MLSFLLTLRFKSMSSSSILKTWSVCRQLFVRGELPKFILSGIRGDLRDLLTWSLKMSRTVTQLSTPATKNRFFTRVSPVQPPNSSNANHLSTRRTKKHLHRHPKQNKLNKSILCWQWEIRRTTCLLHKMVRWHRRQSSLRNRVYRKCFLSVSTCPRKNNRVRGPKKQMFLIMKLNWLSTHQLLTPTPQWTTQSTRINRWVK
jgi:hypothetical protein